MGGGLASEHTAGQWGPLQKYVGHVGGEEGRDLSVRGHLWAGSWRLAGKMAGEHMAVGRSKQLVAVKRSRQ